MNLWQSKQWAAFQESLGNKIFWVDNILVLKKNLPFGKCFYEIQRADPTKEFWEKLQEIAKKENAVFCRIAPASEKFEKPNLPIKKSKGQRFPDLTRTIDILASEEEIFAQFSQACRRHIRKAKKGGVVVSVSNDLPIFAQISQETAKRDGFLAHSQNYFETFFSSMNSAELLVATKGDDWLCGGIFIDDGETAYYYYGASSEEYRELNAPTLLQWEAMKRAKSKGCTAFDLLGIAPENNANHRLSGVSRFKKKFGGKVREYYPETNIIFSCFWFVAYRFAKYIRLLFRK